MSEYGDVFYNLPDGKTTKSVKVYLNRWNKYNKKLLGYLDPDGMLGYQIIAFDPVVRITKVNANGNSTLPMDLPKWFINDLIQTIDDQKQLEFLLHSRGYYD